MPGHGISNSPFLTTRYGGGGGGFDPDYQAILDYATAQGFILPSAQEQIIANQFMIELKAASSSGLVGYGMIKVYATNINYGGSIPALLDYTGINWANAGSNQSTRINTITQALKEGYSSDGTTSYINENILADAVSQDDVFYALQINNMTADLRNGVTNGSYEGVYLGYNGHQVGVAINGTAITVSNATAGTTPGGDYFISGVRDNSSDFDLWVDGVNKTTVTSSTTNPSSNIETLAANFIGGGGRFFSNSANIVGINIIGKATEVDQAVLYTAVNTYLTALSAL